MESENLTHMVSSARAGDEAAWNALVMEYTPMVSWVVRSFRLGDMQSADAVQTTWLRLVEHLDSVRDPERLAGWLRTTARRVCLEILRTSRRERPVDTGREWVESDDGPESLVSHENVETGLLREEHRALVRRVVAGLGERDRMLLSMLAASQVSYAEISARLGMPIGSIGPTRARLLARLRGALAQLGVTDAALN